MSLSPTLCLWPSLSLYVSLAHTLSLWPSISLDVSLSHSLSLWPSLSLCVSLSHTLSLWPSLSLYVSLSHTLSLSGPLFLSMYLSHTHSLSLAFSLPIGLLAIVGNSLFEIPLSMLINPYWYPYTLRPAPYTLHHTPYTLFSIYISHASWPVPQQLSTLSVNVGYNIISQNVFMFCFAKSIPAQIRQLILYIIYNKRRVDGFVRELTFAKRLYKHFL